MVDENDLCWPGGSPGPLGRLLGIRIEETDGLYPGETNALEITGQSALGLQGVYEARSVCELVHADSAQVLGTYARDFYRGRPALTVNAFGAGRAFYVACDCEDRFFWRFYRSLRALLGIRRALDVELPAGVTAHMRTDGLQDYVFLLNFNREPATVSLPDEPFRDILRGLPVAGPLELGAYGFMVLGRPTAGVDNPA